jgi:hypothetical protein
VLACVVVLWWLSSALLGLVQFSLWTALVPYSLTARATNAATEAATAGWMNCVFQVTSTGAGGDGFTSRAAQEELLHYLFEPSHQKHLAAFVGSALLVWLGLFDVVVGARLRGYMYNAKAAVFVEAHARTTSASVVIKEALRTECVYAVCRE